jgi:hypothetical protein
VLQVAQLLVTSSCVTEFDEMTAVPYKRSEGVVKR